MSNEIEDMELACRVLYSQNGSVYLVPVGKCDYDNRYMLIVEILITM